MSLQVPAALSGSGLGSEPQRAVARGVPCDTDEGSEPEPGPCWWLVEKKARDTASPQSNQPSHVCPLSLRGSAPSMNPARRAAGHGLQNRIVTTAAGTPPEVELQSETASKYSAFKA